MSLPLELNFSYIGGRSIIERIRRQTKLLIKAKKYKEVCRDFFVCFCFYHIYRMKRNREIDNLTYYNYLMVFFRYANMRFI